MRLTAIPAFGWVILLTLGFCVESLAQDDDLAARALAAGLSESQADSVAHFGHPVAAPTDATGFELVDFDLGESHIGDLIAPYYLLHYRRADGACVTVDGDSEGLGGLPWPGADHPPITIPALARQVWILEDTYGTDEEGGGPSALGIDWIDLGDPDRELVEGGDMHASVQTGSLFGDDDCRPLPIDEFAAFVASLQPLNPVHDRTPETD